MMKNYFLTLLAVLMFSASFSQLDLETVLVTPTQDTISQHGNQFQPRVINRGTVAVPAGSILSIKLTMNGATLGNFTFTITATSTLGVGDTLTFSPLVITPQVGVTTATYDKICTEINAPTSMGADATPANNTACFWIERSFVSVDEITLENSVKVFATSSKLNLSSTKAETLNYKVYSVSGKLVTSGTFTSSKQVDMNFAKGIYAVVISNGKERFTKKIAVQ
jgi:hypothetical protein